MLCVDEFCQSNTRNYHIVHSIAPFIPEVHSIRAFLENSSAVKHDGAEYYLDIVRI